MENTYVLFISESEEGHSWCRKYNSLIDYCVKHYCGLLFNHYQLSKGVGVSPVCGGVVEV